MAVSLLISIINIMAVVSQLNLGSKDLHIYTKKKGGGEGSMPTVALLYPNAIL